ncbi:CDP-alcohol phosphatidyltransferase family protein [Myxococcaceae bacterium GXIMD 01537]
MRATRELNNPLRPAERPERRRLKLVLLNALSLSRLVFAVLFPLVDSRGARVGLIVAAALSDFLDGWIARHAHLTTRTGALVDPFADRAFVVTALTTYLVEGSLSPVEYAVLLVRDFSTALGYVVARLVPSLRGVEFKARMPGKIVTTLQLAVLLAVPLLPVLVPLLVLAAGLTALYAVVDYTRHVWHMREA